MNRQLVERLRAHYAEHALPDWGLDHCIRAMLVHWGYTDGVGIRAIAHYLRIDQRSAEILYTLNSDDDDRFTRDVPEHLNTPEQYQAEALRLLDKLLAEGKL